MVGLTNLLTGVDVYKRQGLIFVDREEAEARYAIPSAYAAYTKYLQIRQGSEKVKGDLT